MHNSKQSIYDRPQLYDDMMWWKKDDIEFWKSIIDQTKSDRVLELCCGTGRLGIPIIQKGVNYYGVDISQSFINFFHKKTNDLNYDSNKIIKSDIRNINLGQSFDLIILGFNSLAHLIKDQDVIDCLHHIKSHMSNHSILAIDIFVPKTEFLYNDAKVKSHIMDFMDSEQNLRCQVFVLLVCFQYHLQLFFHQNYNFRPEIIAYHILSATQSYRLSQLILYHLLYYIFFSLEIDHTLVNRIPYQCLSE